MERTLSDQGQQASGPIQDFVENVEDLTKALKDIESPEIARVRAKVKIALAAAKSALADSAQPLSEAVVRPELARSDFLNFADEFRAASRPIIDPDRIAQALQLPLQDLAKLARVHRTTLKEAPGNSRLQAYLRDVVRVLSAASDVAVDRVQTLYWFRNSPISEFGHKTAEELVANGQAEAVIQYLMSIASGSTG